MRDHGPGDARRRLGVVAVLLAIGVGAAALTFTGREPSEAAGSLPAGDFPEPGLGHAHGLGVDPGDGALYVATHFGLLRVEDGRMHRVANRYQDTMGFEVLGPGRFLGSGHPDFREDHPPLLGLIESRDAGQTWTPLSLRGEADFHAIEAAHGNVYAYDSTSETFMVSDDGRDWDRRAQRVLLDFAVSPQDPQTVIAATGTGLHRSTDAGRTWSAVAGAPDLTRLEWDDEVVGLTATGAVHGSGDAGRTWSERGQVGGEPEAMTTATLGARTTLFVAVAERGIFESTDGGETFRLFYDDAQP